MNWFSPRLKWNFILMNLLLMFLFVIISVFYIQDSQDQPSSIVMLGFGLLFFIISSIGLKRIKREDDFVRRKYETQYQNFSLFLKVLHPSVNNSHTSKSAVLFVSLSDKGVIEIQEDDLLKTKQEAEQRFNNLDLLFQNNHLWFNEELQEKHLLLARQKEVFCQYVMKRMGF